ncbi:tetratricopeptide repeat protein [Phormidesmis sp. 146-33]
MTLVDCQPASSTPVTELVSQGRSSLNQQIYLRLRLALSLNLRRQIFVTVCDDVELRDRLALQLRTDLANAHTTPVTEKNGVAPLQASPSRIVSLGLNLPNPDILGQINHWLSQHSNRPANWVPTFQIVGIEALTRQPVHIQRAFLDSLQRFAKQRSSIEFNLVLWVSRPWCRSIQQSVPEFWRWHTGIFEFEGDPAPLGERRNQGAGNQKSRKAPQSSTLIPLPKRVEDSPPTPLTPPRQAEQNPPSSPVPIAKRITPKGEQIIADNSSSPNFSTPPDPQPAKPKAPINRTRADSEFADLVLASVMQDVEQADGISLDQVAADHPSLEPMRLLQHLEELQLAQAPPASHAAAYRQLGDWYRDRVEQGHSSQSNLTVTVRAYEQVLRFLEPTSSQAPDVLNDVGNLYWMLSRCPTAADIALPNLEKALKAYQLALSKINPQTRPSTFAMVQNNLGSAYSDLAQRQNPAENLQQAIAAYQSSLQYRQIEEEASRYAATQNNLGTAHWNLAQHQNPIDNLQQAIAYYSAALRHYDPDQEPLHYAMLQNNMGTAYWNLAQCAQGSEQADATPGDFLLLAIGAYRIALMYRTLDAAPAAYASTQNNLGTAYWHLANQPSTHYDEAEGYLHQAIAAYKEAIAAVDYLTTHMPHPPALTFDRFSTYNNLGSAFYQLATATHAELDTQQRLAYLEASLSHHVQALHGWQDKPDFYSTALNCIVQNVRAFHERSGIQGQTQALSKIPATLIPAVMKQL